MLEPRHSITVISAASIHKHISEHYKESLYAIPITNHLLSFIHFLCTWKFGAYKKQVLALF